MPDGKRNHHFFRASTACHFVWCISWPMWRISHFVHFPWIPRFSPLMQHVAYQWEWSLVDSWVQTRRIFGVLAFRPLNIRDWSHSLRSPRCLLNHSCGHISKWTELITELTSIILMLGVMHASPHTYASAPSQILSHYYLDYLEPIIQKMSWRSKVGNLVNYWAFHSLWFSSSYGYCAPCVVSWRKSLQNVRT